MTIIALIPDEDAIIEKVFELVKTAEQGRDPEVEEWVLEEVLSGMAKE